MKNLLFILFFVATTFLAKAQDSTIALTKFEKMATAPGTFYSIEEKILGAIKGENVTVIKTRNVITNESSAMVRISPVPFNANSTPIISNSNLYIDKEDVEPLLKNLQFYSKEIKGHEQVSGRYYSFVTSTDVQFLFKFEEHFFSDSYLSIRKLYQHLRSPVLNSTINFSQKDIDRLIELLKTAASEI